MCVVCESVRACCLPGLPMSCTPLAKCSPHSTVSTLWGSTSTDRHRHPHRQARSLITLQGSAALSACLPVACCRSEAGGHEARRP